MSPNATDAGSGVDDHRYDAAIVTERQPTGQIVTQVQLGETMGNDTLTQLSLGMFGVAVLDYASRNPAAGFQLPDTQILRSAGGGSGGTEVSSATYASRLIVGAVFGILIFLTIVIYGMWVAAGVVAEKSSRVMELLISAASPRQLVLGKVLGIGLAGATQVAIVLTPAILVLLLEDRIATALLGPSAGIAPSLQALSPSLLGAFAVYYVLGFALYSLVYAAAGSLVSRPEDLQIIALPLSLIAILGYLQAILALTGGITWFIRLASYIPFWSPFVMLTRLSVGRRRAHRAGDLGGDPRRDDPRHRGDRGPDLRRGRAALRAAPGCPRVRQRGAQGLKPEPHAPASLVVEEERQPPDQRDDRGGCGRRLRHDQPEVRGRPLQASGRRR